MQTHGGLRKRQTGRAAALFRGNCRSTGFHNNGGRKGLLDLLDLICQIFANSWVIRCRCHPGEQRPSRRSYLRGPAIGQGRRVSWVLGSGTLKSRSRNPGNKKKLVTARPVRSRGGLPILGHRVAWQRRRLRPSIAGEISCGFYEIRPKEQAV